MTFERFAVELRETFQNYRNGTDGHWQAVARRALTLAGDVAPESGPDVATDATYLLARFHCISPGRDSMRAIDLGLPTGPRAYVEDHWERWFENGAVFVCEPGSGQINIALAAPMFDESGKAQSTVPMGPKSGRIMRKSM